MIKTNVVDWVALLLLVLGGINWGLVGIFKWNLITFLMGDMSVFARIAYTVIAICALYVLFVISYKLAKK